MYIIFVNIDKLTLKPVHQLVKLCNCFCFKRKVHIEIGKPILKPVHQLFMLKVSKQNCKPCLFKLRKVPVKVPDYFQSSCEST